MINPPPTELMYDGPAEDYVSNGLEFLGHYKTLCNLQPTERMLDVGSGLGRKTIPLTEYLTTGSYEGFDCTALGVRWCQDNITSVYPNFRFQHVDVYAPGYNQKGIIQPTDFVFPFEDKEFDFVMLGSVFTHMQYGAVEHYLKEIHRVLKVGGRCLITWFLSNPAVTPFIFSHRLSYGWYSNKNLIEEAIAFDTSAAIELYHESGFDVQCIELGSWSGRKGLSYQDMIVARRPIIHK